MMLRQQLVCHLWTTCLVAASGCSLLPESPVAEVGPYQITASALNDFVLAPLEEGIDFSAGTGVEATSWGQFKSSLGQ